MPDKLTTSDPAMLTLQAGMLLLLLSATSLSDLKRREIPDRLQLAIASLTFLSFSLGNFWGILGALPYPLVALFFGGCGGMRDGDTELAATTRLVLGLLASLAASILGLGNICLVCGLITVKWRLHGKREKIPFPVGPFLATGAVTAYFMKVGGLILWKESSSFPFVQSLLWQLWRPFLSAAAVGRAGKPGGSLRPAFSYGMRTESK